MTAFTLLMDGSSAPASCVSIPTGAAEQTQLSWARSLESYDAVPDVYSAFFGPLRAEGRDLPYALLTPSYEGFIRRTTEKLVCDVGREIHVLERKGNTCEAQCYPLEGISFVQVRTVLLDSRIKITGVTRNGVSASSTIKFNSVTDYLFVPILEKIRFASGDFRGAVRSSELAKFDHWITLNYKFMNYARRSLLGEETVLHAILQPEIRVNLLTVLGKTYYRAISPTHASILTDRELIMISEDEKQSGDTKYGGISDYIPLNKIVDLSLGRKDGDVLVLSVHLPEAVRLEYIFQASAEHEVARLLDQVRGLTAVRARP